MSDGVITAFLEHKFDVSQIESTGKGEIHYSPVMSVVHNGVNLTFQLRCKSYKFSTGLSIVYVDGPDDVLTVNFTLFVAKGPQQVPFELMRGGKELEFIAKNKKLGHCYGSSLPNTLEKLKTEGYLVNDSLLQAFAVLLIPESAFKDPSHKCPASSAQNPFIHDLFAQIEAPTATNSPFYNRFELISNDGHHFWVHKDVLAFNSDVFKRMFDPDKPEEASAQLYALMRVFDKPEEARFKYLREGRIELKNVSGGALREMLNFIYLKHTTPHFGQFAMELVPVAEMYELKGLRLMAVETLIVQTKKEKDIDELFRVLAVSRLHKLSNLDEACVRSLGNVVQQTENVDRGLILRLTGQAQEHGYSGLKSICQEKLVQYVKNTPNLTVPIILELASEANKYGLGHLLMECGQWLGRNWESASSSGQFNGVIDDQTGGMFTQLVGFALKK